jgi:inner membrane protein
VDTLTHALLGAACALALSSRRRLREPDGACPTPRRATTPSRGVDCRAVAAPAVRAVAGWTPLQRAAIAAGAAAFPDVDFALFPLDPLRFLADWHQGPTHALPMAPLWALLVAAVACALRRDRVWARTPAGRSVLLQAWGWALLGLLSHAAADLATAYGLAWAWPLSGLRVGVGMTWVFDALWTLPLAAGLLAAWRWRRAWPATAALAAVLAVALAQAALQQQALAIAQAEARNRGLPTTSATALAQPLSPLHWQLLLVEGEEHAVARLVLPGPRPLATMIRALPGWPGLGELQRLAGAYQPAEALVWHRHALTMLPRPGGASRQGAWLDDARAAPAPLAPETVRAAWADPALATYRRFARFPALSRIDFDPVAPHEDGGDESHAASGSSSAAGVAVADAAANRVDGSPGGHVGRSDGDASVGAPGPLCIWFTDLRYDLPGWPDTFRVGVCREAADAPWQAHRLRYLRADARQRLR